MENATLTNRILAAREQWVEVGGYKFKLRRPSEVDLIRERDVKDQFVVSIELVIRHIVGWENVHEADMLPSGSSDAVPFASDACSEWISDRPDLWEALIRAMYEAVGAYGTRVAELRKK